MQIVIHLGAHGTDGGLLIRSILRNGNRLAKEGIIVPGPYRYREAIGNLSTQLRGDVAEPDMEATLIASFEIDEKAERVVLSSENFLCRKEVALGVDGLYPKAEKSGWLRKCFPSHEVEFALALRNPAHFVAEIAPSAEIDAEDLARLSVETLLWSDVIADILTANPGAPLYCWCHEDTPFTWLEIMRELTAHDPFTELEGEFDMLETIMSQDGMVRLTEFLDSRHVSDQIKRRRAVSAFLEAHALDDKVESEIDIPGWTDKTVTALTEAYEEDVVRIAAMPEVTFITP